MTAPLPCFYKKGVDCSMTEHAVLSAVLTLRVSWRGIIVTRSPVSVHRYRFPVLRIRSYTLTLVYLVICFQIYCSNKGDGQQCNHQTKQSVFIHYLFFSPIENINRIWIAELWKSNANTPGSGKRLNRNTHRYFILLFFHIKIKVPNV